MQFGMVTRTHTLYHRAKFQVNRTTTTEDTDGFGNEEFPVSASHKLALITSLPFVHTARRYYRLNVLVRYLDRRLRG